MSSKWIMVGTNALETWNPEHLVKDPKEKAKFRLEREKRLFKYGMKIQKMKLEKPKRVFKEEKDELI